MRDRLIELHKQAFELLLKTGQDFSHENYADYLLANGVIFSTEDVVPRSEVEKIFEDFIKEIELALDSNYKARNNNGYGEFGEYVNGKIHALRGIEDFLAELKKKYIGEKRCLK